MELLFKIMNIVAKYIKEKPVRSLVSIAITLMAIGVCTVTPVPVMMFIVVPIWIIIMTMINIVIDY